MHRIHWLTYYLAWRGIRSRLWQWARSWHLMAEASLPSSCVSEISRSSLKRLVFAAQYSSTWILHMLPKNSDFGHPARPDMFYLHQNSTRANGFQPNIRLKPHGPIIPIQFHFELPSTMSTGPHFVEHEYTGRFTELLWQCNTSRSSRKGRTFSVAFHPSLFVCELDATKEKVRHKVPRLSFLTKTVIS